MNRENQDRLFPVHSERAQFQPGDRITAAYRNYRWNGTVLAVNNPQAWNGTLFDSKYHSQEEIDSHCDQFGIDGTDSVPVAWDFGKVYWENTESIEHLKTAKVA